MNTSEHFSLEKRRAEAWFVELRDRIREEFERLELSCSEGPMSEREAAKFSVIETKRRSVAGEDAGGGAMSILRDGRIFEKAGVNVSTVYGSLGEKARRHLTSRRSAPGPNENPIFWASGISLVAHAQNPRVPAVHLNTRMFWAPGAWWFGGGADLNPCIEFEEDTRFFHAKLKSICARHDSTYYPKFRKWADAYFFISHRNRSRGVGGIFFDDLNTGDWEADFAFVKDVGLAFLEAYPALVERRRGTPWNRKDREIQLLHRGLYAEFNLIYDRGTRFGLESGHDPDAVLMSLPPLAKWR
ncbi:MAG: oxygen-dependent coproporphyrinogen oxidase [Albidovulum sp.]|nr:oxygen-dependent coproporphyrinogen oxidase [Albidovulum sp.]